MVFNKYLDLKDKKNSGEEEDMLKEIQDVDAMPVIEPEPQLGEVSDEDTVDLDRSSIDSNVQNNINEQPIDVDSKLNRFKEILNKLNNEPKEIEPEIQSGESTEVLNALGLEPQQPIPYSPESNVEPMSLTLASSDEQIANDTLDKQEQEVVGKDLEETVKDIDNNQKESTVAPKENNESVVAPKENIEQSRIMQLLNKINESRDAESESIESAADKNRMVRALLGMLKGGQQIMTARAGGSLVNIKPDVSTQDQLIKQSNLDYKNEVNRIKGRTENVTKKLGDIPLEAKLKEIDPQSDISKQARILFASKVGPEIMNDLERQGIDLNSLNYQQLVNLQGKFSKDVDFEKKQEIKDKISAKKMERLDRNLNRKERRQDQKEIRDLGKSLTGVKRGGMLKKQWMGLVDIEEMQRKIDNAISGTKLSRADATDLSASWSKVLSGGVPSQSLIELTMPTSYRSKFSELVNWVHPEDVKMSYYTKGMLRHMEGQLNNLKETRDWAIARSIKNASNTYSLMFQDNPRELKKHMKQFKKYIAWDDKEKIFRNKFNNKTKNPFIQDQLRIDREGETPVQIPNGKVKVTNGEKILLIPSDRLSEAEKDGFTRIE